MLALRGADPLAGVTGDLIGIGAGGLSAPGPTTGGPRWCDDTHAIDVPEQGGDLASMMIDAGRVS